MLHNRSFAKDCLVSRNPEADFQHSVLLVSFHTARGAMISEFCWARQAVCMLVLE